MIDISTGGTERAWAIAIGGILGLCAAVRLDRTPLRPLPLLVALAALAATLPLYHATLAWAPEGWTPRGPWRNVGPWIMLEQPSRGGIPLAFAVVPMLAAPLFGGALAALLSAVLRREEPRLAITAETAARLSGCLLASGLVVFSGMRHVPTDAAVAIVAATLVPFLAETAVASAGGPGIRLALALAGLGASSVEGWREINRWVTWSGGEALANALLGVVPVVAAAIVIERRRLGARDLRSIGLRAPSEFAAAALVLISGKTWLPAQATVHGAAVAWGDSGGVRGFSLEPRVAFAAAAAWALCLALLPRRGSAGAEAFRASRLPPRDMLEPPCPPPPTT